MDWLVVAFYGVLGASVIATTIMRGLDRLPSGLACRPAKPRAKRYAGRGPVLGRLH